MAWYRSGTLHSHIYLSRAKLGFPGKLTSHQTTEKLANKAKTNLDANYSYLGGNAFGRDKQGRVKKDDSAVNAELQAAGHGDAEYTPYVYYEFVIQ